MFPTNHEMTKNKKMALSKKKKVNSDGWKSVKFDGAIVNSEIGELIGIEEMTDYKLEDGKIISLNSSNSEKSTKRLKSKTEKVEPSATKRKRSPSEGKKAKKKKKPPQKLEKKTSKLDENLGKSNAESEEIESNINEEAWSTLGVPPVIIKALRDQNFVSPTQIQSLTLAPAILGRRDILGAAETGSGKTLAFGIPILNGILELKKKERKSVSSKSGEFQESNLEDTDEVEKEEGIEGKRNSQDLKMFQKESEDEVLDDEDSEGFGCVKVIDNLKVSDVFQDSRKPLYALILTPTRELAIQIKDHLTKAAKYTDIRISVILGGMAAVKQERILSKGPEIVIATPGRLWELVSEGNPHLSQLNSIKFLAIDETDRMLEKGHFKELHSIIEKVNLDESKVKERQTFVFSATLTMVHDIPDYLKMKKKNNWRSKIFKLTPGQKLQKVIEMLQVKNPKIVDVTRKKGTAGSLTECRIACTIDYKDYYLYYFLKRHEGRTLVFCNSIGCVKRLATLFEILGCHPFPLHASMVQRQRLKNLERFQANENALLIATDVAARGLDIPNVEHVIHYQVPRTSESYVHRSGRTARAQKEGITVLLMEPTEKDFYTRICKTLGREHDIPTFPVVERMLQAVKERVDVAREIDKLELKSRRSNFQKDWIRKAAEEMDLIIDDARENTTSDNEETANIKRALKAKRHQLSNMLLKPLFPRGFSGKYPDVNFNLKINEEPQKAVEIMQNAIKEGPQKKDSKSKFKPKPISASKLKSKMKNKKIKSSKNRNSVG
ncbi:ATP-dependent RNA helicase DDX24 isoform X1 [Belonocnema kinseyi]|uniref:ATP-dependent RNA helicase DDX24 isoform X1 n=2 Tax=Belonocnema kinseyi TaxID=2817044 RepID=UPI00143DC2DA|nr:ATP-dependent RNA helicase DDX24 isoform X1 [Belonocnema kinseyi]